LLKLLLLADAFERDDGTGPLAPLLDRLEGRGLSPQVFCFKKVTPPPDDRRVIEVPQLANRWLRSWAVRRLWSDPRAARPDVVHALDESTSTAALVLSESAKILYLQSVNNFATLETGLKLSRRWCRRIVAGSHDLAGDLVRDLGVPAGLITVILPGIVQPSPAPPASGVKGVAVVGTTGASQDVESFTIFLEAAKRVLETGCEAEFVIATDEREHAELRRRAKNLGVDERVTVTDYSITGPRFWSLLDIYCQPSVGPSAGRSLLYALAHGVPSIVTDVKGLRSLIEPGKTAVLIPPADPQALHQAVVDLLQSPDEALRLGQRARESVRSRFDPDVEADNLTALYREVVDQR
jgi:glycosyltransferase involved in cell wall biosynthesis